MKTIEERAKKFADVTDGQYDILSEEVMSFWRDDYNNYIQIATEQRAIDIDIMKYWFMRFWASDEYFSLEECLESMTKAMTDSDQTK